GTRLDRHLAGTHPIEEEELAVPRALDPLQELLRDDLISIDVRTVEHRDVTLDRRDRLHQFHSLISTKCPSIAAAAAICGDTRCVRPPAPWRPSKLRLEVDA